MSTGHATDAEEEYLQALFWLQEAELPMTGANVAKAMQLAPPTVHEMIGRLVEDGYIAREPDKSLRFTDDGRRHAEAIVTRHRLIERFLTDVLGIPWDEVHEEAERMEHAMSPRMEERMMAAIGDAKTCPHGHPIILEERIRGSLLADCEVGAEVRITRADGRTAVFAVTRVATHPKNRFPSGEVYGPIDHAGLRLITCGGDFDRRTGHYADNVVAYARLRSVLS